MINSVYRKTTQNLRNQINVRLVNNEKDILKDTNKRTPITLFNKKIIRHKMREVLVSSIENEVNKTISIFFTKKIWAHKNTNQIKAN